MMGQAPNQLYAARLSQLSSDLYNLDVRQVNLPEVRGMGLYEPSVRAWRSGAVDNLVSDFKKLLNADCRIGIVSEEKSLPAMKLATAKFLGEYVIEKVAGKNMYRATIEDIRLLDLGRLNGQDLPIVEIREGIELSPNKPEYDPYALTLGDLAHLLQRDQAELRL